MEEMLLNHVYESCFFNVILKLGYFPASCSERLIEPIYKNGRNAFKPHCFELFNVISLK